MQLCWETQARMFELFFNGHLFRLAWQQGHPRVIQKLFNLKLELEKELNHKFSGANCYHVEFNNNNIENSFIIYILLLLKTISVQVCNNKNNWQPLSEGREMNQKGLVPVIGSRV